MSIQCPYCKTNKKSNGTSIVNWLGIRAHAARCSLNDHTYVITDTFGPIHYSEFINSDLDELKSKYGTILVRNANNTFKKYGIIKENIYRYSKEDCTKAAKDYFISNNKVPIADDFRVTNGKFPSLSVITKFFGTWNNFLIESGFKPVRVAGKAYYDCSKQGIINAIISYVATNGHLPSYKDFNYSEGLYPSSGTVERVFGSWNTAISAAGFTPKDNTYGTPSKALDGHVYRSRAESYFVDKFLYGKYIYEIEPAYPEQYKKYYDWYIPSIDLYIELDGGIRPMITLDKIEINKTLNRKCLFIPIVNVYKTEFNNLVDFMKEKEN